MVIKMALQVDLETGDSAAHSMASVIMMRRSSWLHYFGLPPEVQWTVQDLRFEGPLLLSQERWTRCIVCIVSESRASLKSLGTYIPVVKRRHSALITLSIFRDLLLDPKPCQRGGAEVRCGDHHLPLHSQLPVHQGRQQLSRVHFDGQVKSSLPIPTVPSFSLPTSANHLSHFHHAWAHVTMDHWVLSTVNVGYTLHFIPHSAIFPMPLQGPLSQDNITARDTVTSYRSYRGGPSLSREKGF